MSFRLKGIGLAVPEHHIQQADAATLGHSFASSDERRARTVMALYQRSGIEKRHSVLLEASDGPIGERQSFYPPLQNADDPGPGTGVRMQLFEQRAPALAAKAARRALTDADLSADEITHLVTVTCTGFFSPGLDAGLVDALGLARGVERTHVGFMGCHGALNGLRVASSFTAADPDARVLLCSVELCTLHLAYGWDPERLVINALFADGAGAVVGVPMESTDAGGAASSTRPGGAASSYWTVAASGTLLLPDSLDAMSWRIGDHGFRMSLSATVPDLIKAHVGDWLHAWLAEQGLAFDDIKTWAVHPGGPRVLTAFGQATGLDSSAFTASREVLSEYGNMSSATILFILDRLRQRQAELPCVALAFGPGLVVEAALIV